MKQVVDPSLRYKNWRTLKLCVLDTETTSRFVEDDEFRIVQFSAQLMQGPDNIIDTIDILINPEIPIPEGASNVHGIFDEDVKDAPVFEEVAPQILMFLLQADLLSAFNYRYDREGLNKELRRVGLPEITMPFLDPLVWERENRNLRSGNTLNEVARRWYCGRAGSVMHGEGNYHNAMVDVEVLGELVYNMAEGRKGSLVLPFSLGELIEKQDTYMERHDEYYAKKHGKN